MPPPLRLSTTPGVGGVTVRQERLWKGPTTEAVCAYRANVYADRTPVPSDGFIFALLVCFDFPELNLMFSSFLL